MQALLVDEAYFAALGHKGFGVTRGRVWAVCMVGGRDYLQSTAVGIFAGFGQWQQVGVVNTTGNRACGQ